ncbi:MAG TPA: hypothetical protein ENJ82_07405 [Bacteroidetes bacterium]|nr:hypothetical protein [Bacteroidota bacterium]
MKQRSKHLETILVIVAGMLIFFFVLDHKVFLYIALGLSLIAILIPLLAKYIHLAWMGLAKVLGFINSHVLLSIIFFIMLTPIALIRKIFTRTDPLKLKRKDTGSYYEDRNHTYQPEDLENPW